MKKSLLQKELQRLVDLAHRIDNHYPRVEGQTLKDGLRIPEELYVVMQKEDRLWYGGSFMVIVMIGSGLWWWYKAKQQKKGTKPIIA